MDKNMVTRFERMREELTEVVSDLDLTQEVVWSHMDSLGELEQGVKSGDLSPNDIAEELDNAIQALGLTADSIGDLAQVVKEVKEGER